MSYLVRTALLGMLILMLACSAWSHHWVNDLLVHRTPTWTENGDVDCLTCHSGEKMRAVGDSVHGDSANPLTPSRSTAVNPATGPAAYTYLVPTAARGFRH